MRAGNGLRVFWKRSKRSYPELSSPEQSFSMVTLSPLGRAARRANFNLYWAEARVVSEGGNILPREQVTWGKNVAAFPLKAT